MSETAPPRRSARILNRRIPPWLRSDCKRLADNDPSLTVLPRQGRMIGPHGSVALGLALRHNSTLKELFLGWNDLGNRGVGHVASGLAERPEGSPILEELNLACNDIRHEGALALVGALGTRRALVQALNLSHNHVGTGGAQVLAAWLREQNENSLNHQYHLTTLCLGNNGIGNEGALAFCTVLQTCRNLKVLHLNENSIDAVGASAISRGLSSENCGLETLDLRGNNIGDSGAESLGNALKHNTSLKTLCLSMNHIGGPGLQAIASGLKDNNSLGTLTLLRNPLTVEGFVALVEALHSRNKTLKWLYVVHNDLHHDWASFSFCTRYRLCQLQKQANYYCGLNRAGRRYIGDVQLPWALWPRIFERISHDKSLLYGFVREKPDLFQNCEFSAT